MRDLLSWCATTSPKTSRCRHSPDTVNLSERQFTRVFKAQVGITAADHVETVRLESACRLLETTNSTIEQIARTCGFGTPETMNRTFRRRLNTTPGDIATTSGAKRSSSQNRPRAEPIGWLLRYGPRRSPGTVSLTAFPAVSISRFLLPASGWRR